MEGVDARYQDRLMVAEISEEQRKKIHRDLKFIKLITSAGRELGLRVVIAGGYAVDGSLGLITRPHNDIDIQVYGNNPHGIEAIGSILNGVVKIDSSFSSMEIKKDHGRKTFYHEILAEKPGLGVDFYYLQIEGTPFGDTKVVIKNNGEKTEPHAFDTVEVELEGTQFEAQSPRIELEDKIKKREKGEEQRPEIDQDIHNLQLLLGQ